MIVARGAGDLLDELLLFDRVGHRRGVGSLERIDVAGLEALEPHVGVDDRPDGDLVWKLRELATIVVLLPVARVLLQHEAVEALEHERSGAHRVPRVVRPHLAKAAGEDISPVVAEEARTGRKRSPLTA